MGWWRIGTAQRSKGPLLTGTITTPGETIDKILLHYIKEKKAAIIQDWIEHASDEELAYCGLRRISRPKPQENSQQSE